jgi:hypothetical protein
MSIDKLDVSISIHLLINDDCENEYKEKEKKNKDHEVVLHLEVH